VKTGELVQSSLAELQWCGTISGGIIEQFSNECSVNTHSALLLQVYSRFDVDGLGKVDWRCMVFMLRVATNAQVPFVQHAWAFCRP